ncbi:c-type cytochrome [Maritalea mobilis]|uniref:c-type cytochrome n=1 Tax=Maritalea mobilis TaxID=483324 RepID=UPI001AAC8ACC|nr:c-type cytochrome [Maritalea mobilis]
MKNLNKWTLGAVAALILAGGYWGYAQYAAPQAEAQTGLLPYKNTQVVAKGEEIYAANCAACHRDNLEGEVKCPHAGAAA